MGKPQQHDAHMKTWHNYVVAKDREWTERLQGKGKPFNPDPDAVRQVYEALSGIRG